MLAMASDNANISAWLLLVLTAFGCGGRVAGGSDECHELVCNDIGTPVTDCVGGAACGGAAASQSSCAGSASCGGAATVTKACTSEVPCGGTLDGTWQFESTCAIDDMVAALNAHYIASGGPAACSDVYRVVEFNTTGTVKFEGGLETDNITDWVRNVVVYTAACDSAVHGYQISMNEARCAALEQEMAAPSSGSDSAVCSLVAGECVCDVSGHKVEAVGPVAYQISGNTVIYPGTSGASWHYCVKGNTMTSWDTMVDVNRSTIVGTLRKL